MDAHCAQQLRIAAIANADLQALAQAQGADTQEQEEQRKQCSVGREDVHGNLPVRDESASRFSGLYRVWGRPYHFMNGGGLNG